MVLKSINCLLVDGTTCKIDIKFYPEFKKHNWCIDSHGYIVTNVPINGKRQILLLHHLVMNFKYDPNIDLVIDHKYGDKRDARKKKLREVSRSTNNLNNLGYDNNTGFERIHCHHDDEKRKYYYQVSYMKINKLRDNKNFHYIPGENEEAAFLKAFEFYEYTLTLPHYVEARPNPDDESSSGESIYEPNYENSVNLKRLNTNNTSKENNISNDGKNFRWMVCYRNDKGIRTSKPFPYNPKSSDTKEEALKKAIKFRDEHKNNRKKYNKKTTNNNTNIVININNIIVKTKKKKKSLPISKKTLKNIEDDGKTSPENDDTESLNDEFRFKNNKFNETKNIHEKSKLDKLIGDNTPKSKTNFDLLLEENTPKKSKTGLLSRENNHTKKSLFDVLLEENTHNIIANGKADDSYDSYEDAMIIESMEERINCQRKYLSESLSDSDTIIMNEDENPSHPYYNNNHTFILK